MSDTFPVKLKRLNGTQESIETLSFWLLFYRIESEILVNLWKKEFDASPCKRKLLFLYLANDVLQKSRKKGSEFRDSFRKILPSVFVSFNECQEAEVKSSAFGIIPIWKNRHVFDIEFCDSLEKIKDSKQENAETKKILKDQLKKGMALVEDLKDIHLADLHEKDLQIQLELRTKLKSLCQNIIDLLSSDNAMQWTKEPIDNSA